MRKKYDNEPLKMEVYNYVDEIPDYQPFIIDAEVELQDLKIYKKKR